MVFEGETVCLTFARDVSKRKQAQRYLTAHYASACILAEARSPAEALPRLISAVCEALRWDAGAFWGLDDAGLLRFACGPIRCYGRHVVWTEDAADRRMTKHGEPPKETTLCATCWFSPSS
jgi:hypothetical protein